ncbi:MAG: tetratricopeptide repeat protein [Pirellula sp.]
MFDQDSDYELNWKAAIITLLLLLVLGLGFFFIHRVQLGRLEKYLVGEIQSAKTSGDQDETIKRLQRYLVYRPDSAEQKVELTELLADPKSPKLPAEALIPMVYQAIASCEQNPQLEDRLPRLREILLDQLSQAMRAGEAVEQIAKLAKPEPDPMLNKKLALIRYRNLVIAGEDPSVGRLLPGTPAWIDQKCKLDPVDHVLDALGELKGDVELTAMLGNAAIIDSSKLTKSNLSKLDKDELKSLVSRKLAEMLERNPDQPEAWLINYQLLSLIDSKKAALDIETALVRFPEDGSILQQGAVHKMSRILAAKRESDQETIDKEIGAAEAILEKIRKGPGVRSTFTYSALSELSLVKNEREKAIQALEDGIRVCQPPLVDLRLRIAQIYNEAAEYDKALDALKLTDEALRQDAPRLNAAQQTEFARAIKQQWLEYYNAQGNLVAVNEQLDSLLVTTATSDTNTELRIQAFAAESFRKIGYWDKASNAYLRALALAPRNDQLRRGAAECLVKSNRTPDAIKQLEVIINKQPGDWMQMALLQMLLQTTDLSFDEDQWRPIQVAIDKARESSSASGNQDEAFGNLLEVLQADLDVRRTNPSNRANKIAELKPKLLELTDANPNQELLLKNIVNLFGVWGELDSARDVRKILIEKNPQSLDAHLDHATELANSGKSPEAVEYLMGRLADFPESIRLTQFLIASIQIDDQFGTRVEKILDSCGTNFAVMSDVCEHLLRVPQYTSEVSEQNKAKSLPKVQIWNSAMQSAEMRLRKLEGEKGTAWRYTKARRMLIKSLFDEKPDFANVLDLIRQIEEVRPDWAYLNVLRGALSEQMKEPSKAIKSYQAAAALSVDDIRVYERLIELLYQEGRFEEAETYINRLGNVSNQSNRIASVALRLSERSQANTLDVAKRGTESRPLDPLAWVWYAKVIERTSRLMAPEDRKASIEQAESYLQRARQLAPDQSDPVRALFQHYALTKQVSKIDPLADEIESSKLIVPEHERWNTLGCMFLYLNRLDRAEDCFNKSLASGGNPGTNSMLRAETMVRLGRQNEAIEFLTDFVKRKPEVQQIRHGLVLILANRGTPEDWQQIENVLTAPPFGNSVDDRLLHARLLMSNRSYRDLEKAREKLQGIAGVRSANTSEILFTLGTINRYLLDLSNRDDIRSVDTRSYQEAAESALEQAAVSMPPNENYLTGYASFLIERKKLNNAEPIIEKLNSSFPNSRGTALAKALWYQAKGKPDAARQAVLEWFAQVAKVDYSPSMDLSNIPADTLAFSNALFEAVEDSNAADQTFEALLDRNPQVALNYLKALVRHDSSKLRNAGLQRLTRSFDELNLTPMDTSVVLSFLSSLQYDQDKTAEIIKFLKSKLDQAKDNGKDIDMIALVSIGDFFLSKRAAAEALDCYRKIVEKDPKNPGSLNNLANLLIETSPQNAQEALGYIDRAVEQLPDNAVLLDTKGTVLILLERYNEAAAALSVATQKGGDPRSALHWYMALVGAGKTDEAEKVKQMIDKKVLRDVYLLPGDKEVLEKL